jgi:DNA invertase Pin-like site-specific DNA recombinase
MNVTKSEATRRTGRRQTRARGRRLFGGYARVSQVGSREKDERLRSPEFQAELVDRRAREEDVDVRLFDAELDVSGSRKARVILDSIIEAIEAGELDGIIVAKLDRLSRLAPKDRIEVVERIEAAGGVILSASETFDSTTPEGRFVRDIFFGVARLEWERYADNWTYAKANAIAAGVSISRDAAFGYRFDSKHRLVVEPAEAGIVVELFELRATGEASWTDLLELFERRTGRRTARQTMSALVRNRVYLGEVSYGDELAKAGAHKPIVELDLFETVQRVNEERAGDVGGWRHTGAAVTFLGGIATCEGCGRPVSGHKRRAQADRYSCRSARSHCPEPASLVAAELDAFVWTALLEWSGEAADELVELEAELGARGDRIVAETRLADARRVADAYELDVELELELGQAAYAAGRRARRDLVELRETELEAIGEASDLELVRTTLRQASEEGLEDEEKRRLLKVALAGGRLVIRRAPRASTWERVVALELGGAPATSGEDALELLEHVARRNGSGRGGGGGGGPPPGLGRILTDRAC